MCLQRLERSGWMVNMHLVPLPQGGLLVCSPTWVGDDTFARVESYGAPRVLLAPNHFHHLSLSRFKDRYPEAVVVASDAARPRLERQGHADVAPLSAARPHLGEDVELLPCEGTKSGETWVRFDEPGRVTLIVGDAFFHVPGPVSGLMGVVLRLLKTVPGLCLGSTFPWLALRDRAAYALAARDTFERVAPTRMAFAHGEELTGDDLTAELSALIQRRLGV